MIFLIYFLFFFLFLVFRYSHIRCDYNFTFEHLILWMCNDRICHLMAAEINFQGKLFHRNDGY